MGAACAQVPGVRSGARRAGTALPGRRFFCCFFPARPARPARPGRAGSPGVPSRRRRDPGFSSPSTLLASWRATRIGLLSRWPPSPLGGWPGPRPPSLSRPPRCGSLFLDRASWTDTLLHGRRRHPPRIPRPSTRNYYPSSEPDRRRPARPDPRTSYCTPVPITISFSCFPATPASRLHRRLCRRVSLFCVALSRASLHPALSSRATFLSGRSLFDFPSAYLLHQHV